MFSRDYDSTGESTFAGLVYELRPWQWYKQIVLFIAVVFSGSAGELDAWLRVTAGAVLFSAVAGSTYVLNDVSDVEKDRSHPRKQHRPVASGQVSIVVALGFALTTYFVAGILSWQLSPLFFWLIGLYVGQNVLYSHILKNLLFVDLFSISAGFVIRAVAGVVLVGAPLSPWLVLCIFLTALMLGVSKRWRERKEVENPTDVRTNLDGYSIEVLQFLFGIVAATLLVSYSLYTFFVQGIAMMLTIPFAFYAVFRFTHLTFTEEGAFEPHTLLLDRPLVLDFVLWGLTVIAVLYQPSLGIPT